MSKLIVEGMHRLQGEVTIQGSKNAVLPILSACVLNKGETILHGCPKIRDVSSMLSALQSAGAKVKWEGHVLTLNTSEMHPVPLIENAGSTRSSVMLLGSFLARFGKVILGYPGGCCIGKRPIDLHEQALSALGAVFCEESDHLEARTTRLEGCDIYLPYTSVGVTENILLAAAGAHGQTRIYGAAKEPEITELCKFLTEMGARIEGIGSDRLTIMGGELRNHAEYTICPDRIVAGTYLFAAAAAGGEVLLKNVPLLHMKSTIQTAGRLGLWMHRDGTNLQVRMEGRCQPVPFIKTFPYPGFPTDLQSPLLAVLCRADGNSRIEESVFENRFLIAEELRKMGALIEVEGRTAFITPVPKLKGCEVAAKDLRGGAALVVAALGAEGETVVQNAQVISRGYEDLAGDLNALGAKIQCFPNHTLFEKP